MRPLLTASYEAGGECIVSAKYSALAFDALKEGSLEYSFESGFQPELQVIINANYGKTSSANTLLDVVEVKGRITVSF